MLTFVCFEPFDFAFEALGRSIWAKNLPPRILKALKKRFKPVNMTNLPHRAAE